MLRFFTAQKSRPKAAFFCITGDSGPGTGYATV